MGVLEQVQDESQCLFIVLNTSSLTNLLYSDHPHCTLFLYQLSYHPRDIIPITPPPQITTIFIFHLFPALVDGSARSGGSVQSLVRRSRTATDLNNPTQQQPTTTTTTTARKLPAYMQPTMSSQSKLSRMPRSSSSTTIATVHQIEQQQQQHQQHHHQVQRQSASSILPNRPTAITAMRKGANKSQFQSTPDLSGRSASAAIASSICSETETDPEDTTGLVEDRLHDRLIQSGRSPAERKAYALRAMRQSRNRSGSESAIGASLTASVTATFDDDDDEEEDSGVGIVHDSTSGKVTAPSPVPSLGSKSGSTLQPSEYKSKLLQNAMARASSPFSSDSNSTGNASSNESPGDVLRRELEREKCKLRSSPLSSPQQAPPPIAPKPFVTSVSSPLRKQPVGIVHPSSMVTTTTVTADQGPLVRLIDSSISSASDDTMKNVKAVAVIPENGELETSLNDSIPSSGRRQSTGSYTTSPMHVNGTNGSPSNGTVAKRPNRVLISQLRKPLNSSPASGGTSSPIHKVSPAVAKVSSPRIDESSVGRDR